MSKIGKQPITIPEGITVKIDQNEVSVAGPLGKLSLKVRPEMKVVLAEKKGQVLVEPKNASRMARSLHGLTRTLINNMIEGVVKGFEKILEIQGVGYRAALEGQSLHLSLGFSHPVIFPPPSGIKFSLEGNNLIKINGIDKQLVGQTAAQIRDIKLPDAYKGKGIRYQGEIVKLKPGKAAKTGAAG